MFNSVSFQKSCLPIFNLCYSVLDTVLFNYFFFLVRRETTGRRKYSKKRSGNWKLIRGNLKANPFGLMVVQNKSENLYSLNICHVIELKNFYKAPVLKLYVWKIIIYKSVISSSYTKKLSGKEKNRY